LRLLYFYEFAIDGLGLQVGVSFFGISEGFGYFEHFGSAFTDLFEGILQLFGRSDLGDEFIVGEGFANEVEVDFGRAGMPFFGILGKGMEDFGGFVNAFPGNFGKHPVVYFSGSSGMVEGGIGGYAMSSGEFTEGFIFFKFGRQGFPFSDEVYNEFSFLGFISKGG
jgi:hypothetical protein